MEAGKGNRQGFKYLKGLTQQSVQVCALRLQGAENKRDLCMFKNVGEGEMQIGQPTEMNHYVQSTTESLLA